MADIPTPPLPDRTKIWYLGWRLTFLSDMFKSRAKKIQHVWLLGTWLYLFFRGVSDALGYAAGHCYAFDDTIRDIIKWVNGLLDGTVFRALLYWISGHFQDIAEDASKWVRQRFAAWNDDTSLFVYNPIGWFWKRMTFITNWMENFLVNPEIQIKTWVGGFAWWFTSFLDNPSYYIYGWVLEAHPWIKLLMMNPIGFIVHYWKQYDTSLPYFLDQPLYWLYERLKQLPGELGWFVGDPLGYVEYRIQRYTGITLYPDTSFIEAIFFSLINMAETYFARWLGFYRSKLCDIFMLFM